MITTLLATALFGFQNPNPPDVTLLPGWHVEYWGKTKSKKGGIVGPEGQEIGFPDYGSAGTMAKDLRQKDPTAFFTTTVIGGRSVDVALAKDGQMAVSFGKVGNGEHSAYADFDYWMTVRNAQEATQLLLTALTRIEEHKKPRYHNYTPKAFDKAPNPPNPMGDKFDGRVQFPEGYKHKQTRFECKGLPTISYGPTINALVLLDWTEQQGFFGKRFVIEAPKNGMLTAFFQSSPELTFSTQENTPKAAIILILSRLSLESAAR